MHGCLGAAAGCVGQLLGFLTESLIHSFIHSYTFDGLGSVPAPEGNGRDRMGMVLILTKLTFGVEIGDALLREKKYLVQLQMEGQEHWSGCLGWSSVKR